MGFDLDTLKKAIVKVGEAGAVKDVKAVDAHADELKAVLEELHEIFGDGFQWSDVPVFVGEVVPSLMDIAKEFKDASGAEKKQFVVDAVVTIYYYYDPNLPWIPEPFETKLEEWIVPRLAEASVEAAYKFGKKRGWWSADAAATTTTTDNTSTNVITDSTDT